MTTTQSQEVESVARRALIAYMWDSEALSNLVTSDPRLRVLGSDLGELWSGPDQFLSIRETQRRESGLTEEDAADFRVDSVEGFQDGDFGWATMFWTLVTPEGETQLRTTAVLRIEAGVWRVIQWHNSIPVANERVYGVDLTITLDDLVSSVLDDHSKTAARGVAEGTLTLVFTDIVDSTRLAETMGDEVWTHLIANHQSVIRAATVEHDGVVVKFLGDGSMLSFQSARAGVRAAIDIQAACSDEPFAIRVGIHSGEVMRTGSDVFGLTVNKAARIAAAAGGGEIMMSSTTRDLVGPLEGTETGEAKTLRLKGIDGEHQIIPIVPV